jgi:hypothetical protein
MHRLVEYFRLIACVKGRNTGLFGNVCLEKLQGRRDEVMVSGEQLEQLAWNFILFFISLHHLRLPYLHVFFEFFALEPHWQVPEEACFPTLVTFRFHGKFLSQHLRLPWSLVIVLHPFFFPVQDA